MVSGYQLHCISGSGYGSWYGSGYGSVYGIWYSSGYGSGHGSKYDSGYGGEYICFAYYTTIFFATRKTRMHCLKKKLNDLAHTVG